jgi:hypothetical protein
LRHRNIAHAGNRLPIGLIRPAFTCFSEMEYKNLNHLILIPLGPGATREGRHPTKVCGGRSGALLRRQLKAVTDTQLGQNVGRPGRVGLELMAQSADEDSKILHLIGLRRAPDLAQQMAVG